MKKSNIPENELAVFKSVVERTKKAIALFEPEGSIIYVNPAYIELFDLSGDIVGTAKLWDRHPQEASKKIEKHLFPALLKGETWQGRMEGLKENGLIFSFPSLFGRATSRITLNNEDF